MATAGFSKFADILSWDYDSWRDSSCKLQSLGNCTDSRLLCTPSLSVKEGSLLALEFKPEEQGSGSSLGPHMITGLRAATGRHAHVVPLFP